MTTERERKEYAWDHYARQNADPQEVGEALEVLIARGGDAPLAPAKIVEAAQFLGSPLHPLFEWDDGVAATAYRHDQARKVVQELRVTFVTDEGEVQEDRRAFINVVVGERRGYLTSVQVASDPTLMRQALRTALRELNSWRRRYADLQELGQVFHVLDALDLARTAPEDAPEPEPVPV